LPSGKVKGNPGEKSPNAGKDAGMTDETEPETELRPRSRAPRRVMRFGLWMLLSLALVVGLAGFGLLALTGKPIRLPVWAVAEAEARLNDALPMGGNNLSIGGVEIAVGRDWVPRLRLEDLRLTRSGGAPLLRLPEARVAFDPLSIAALRLRPASVVLSGASIRLRRDATGRFDLDLGEAGAGPQLGSFAEVMAALDALFARPQLAALQEVTVEALSLRLDDARAGRVWQLGDGRAVLANDPEGLGAELSFTLAGGAQVAQAQLQVRTERGTAGARLRATVEGVAARDLALQAPVLGFLSALDAPISGRLNGSVDAEGQVAGLEAELALGAGALQPSPESKPVGFDSARLALAYDPAQERIDLTEIAVQSRSLRLGASGHVYAPGVTRGRPAAFLAQIAFSEVKVDPEGLFVEPVTFSQGALDLRLRLDPFRLDVGQLTLLEDGRRLEAKGSARADASGWHLALDLALDAIRHDRLLALWPVSAVHKTREWLVENVQEGLLRNVKVALRMEPGAEPRFSLGYDFADGDVRFLKTLPPIRQGSGYATIEGNSYTMVLDRGQVTPPVGGRITMDGSIFSVLDILQKPAQSEIQLRTKSSLTAALSLLDQEPFRFLTKAGRPVELGEGRAEVSAVLRLPLVPHIKLDDVSYQVEGRLSDVRSAVLVPGKELSAPALNLTAGPSGVAITGKGRVGAVPFDATYKLPFGPAAGGKSTITGTVELSPRAVAEFSLGLPDRMVSGQGSGKFTLELPKGGAGRLALTSDLRGLGLALPEIGWRKAPATAGRLEVAATLGQPPQVQALSLQAPGLTAKGDISLRAGGGLDRARFARVQAGNWLDAPVTLTGRGKGRAVGVEVTGGRIDLRRLPERGGSGGASDGAPMRAALDRVQVTDGIALTGLRGEFTTRGGFGGTFTGRVNGGAAVRGTVAPMKGGSGIRITSDDAGGVIASAGIFGNARGGALDLQLVPVGANTYNGIATARNFRVTNAPVLAELLSAISVVGILEQLNGAGLVFAEADAQFRLTPAGVEVSRGAAVGASMGVSAAGTFDSRNKRLNLQGVISPIYLLNGIGSVLTRKGEGLFGFNYKIRGTSDRPEISVNPLSILTPGLFREIFRQPVPKLRPAQ